LLLAAVGQDPQMGIQRYTLSSLYLWNGLNLVPVLVGFFAIPEIIDLAVRGTAIAADAPMGRLSQVREGVFDAFRHIWLTIRCSLIGTYIGIIPGVGGGVAQWIAYAHAVQSAKTPAERDGFGKGDVRGVLGPGAAVNSKERGARSPTMAGGVAECNRSKHAVRCPRRPPQPDGPAHAHPWGVADSLPGPAHVPRSLHEQQQPERHSRDPDLWLVWLLDGALPLAARAAGAGC